MLPGWTLILAHFREPEKKAKKDIEKPFHKSTFRGEGCQMRTKKRNIYISVFVCARARERKKERAPILENCKLFIPASTHLLV